MEQSLLNKRRGNHMNAFAVEGVALEICHGLHSSRPGDDFDMLLKTFLMMNMTPVVFLCDTDFPVCGPMLTINDGYL